MQTGSGAHSPPYSMESRGGFYAVKQSVAYRTLSFNDEVKYDPELYLHSPQKPSRHTQRKHWQIALCVDYVCLQYVCLQYVCLQCMCLQHVYTACVYIVSTACVYSMYVYSICVYSMYVYSMCVYSVCVYNMCVYSNVLKIYKNTKQEEPSYQWWPQQLHVLNKNHKNDFIC